MTTTAPADPALGADAAPATARPPLGATPPPRTLLVVAALVLVVGVALTVVGAWRTGLSWDETYHVLRLRTFLADGWYLLDRDMDGGAPGDWVEQRHVYGPVTMLLLHGWGVLWGVEGPGTVSTTALAYAVRHLGVALLSFVGVAAVAALGRLVLGRWSWGLVAAAALVAVPTWSGHAMFNVKDVPVAVGYTLVTLGVALVVRRAALTPAAGARAAAVLVAGLVLAVGTRPGIWPGLALAGGLGLLVALRRGARGRALLLLACAALALALLTAIYPAAFGSPVTALLDAALSSSRFDGRAGSWWYLPLFLVIELPTLLLVLGAAGVVVLLRRAWWGRRAAGEDVPDAVVVAGLVLLQTLALPGLAVVRESNLYTGLRQLLFAAPGLAVLVACACAALVAVRPRPAVVLVGAALVVPVLVQAQLFPYAYAFSSAPANLVSPLAAQRDRDLEVQTDYWRTSVRELAPAVPADGWVTCTPRIDAEERFEPRSSESREDCAVDPVGPLAPYADTRSGGQTSDPTRFWAVDAGSAFVGSNCTVVDQVTRRLWWRTVPMSTVADCDLVLPALPDGGLAFDGAGAGADWLRGPWEMLRPRPGAGLDGETGLVGLTLPPDLHDRSLTVRGTAEGAESLTVSVNGVPVDVEVRGGAFALDVPADLAAAYGEDRLVLELRGTGLRLLTLDVTEGDRR